MHTICTSPADKFVLLPKILNLHSVWLLLRCKLNLHLNTDFVVSNEKIDHSIIWRIITKQGDFTRKVPGGAIFYSYHGLNADVRLLTFVPAINFKVFNMNYRSAFLLIKHTIMMATTSRNQSPFSVRQLDGLVLSSEERCLLGIPGKDMNISQALWIPSNHYDYLEYLHFQHDVMMYKVFFIRFHIFHVRHFVSTPITYSMHFSLSTFVGWRIFARPAERSNILSSNSSQF